MRTVLVRLRWLGMALVLATGCQQMKSWWGLPDKPQKPPLKEEYILPPSDDARFSQPPQYPKEAFTDTEQKKDQMKPGDRQHMDGPQGGFGSPSSGMGRY
jgi:hypothetical protein